MLQGCTTGLIFALITGGICNGGSDGSDGIGGGESWTLLAAVELRGALEWTDASDNGGGVPDGVEKGGTNFLGEEEGLFFAEPEELRLAFGMSLGFGESGRELRDSWRELCGESLGERASLISASLPATAALGTFTVIVRFTGTAAGVSDMMGGLCCEFRRYYSYCKDNLVLTVLM